MIRARSLSVVFGGDDGGAVGFSGIAEHGPRAPRGMMTSRITRADVRYLHENYGSGRGQGALGFALAIIDRQFERRWAGRAAARLAWRRECDAHGRLLVRRTRAARHLFEGATSARDVSCLREQYGTGRGGGFVGLALAVALRRKHNAEREATRRLRARRLRRALPAPLAAPRRRALAR